MLFIFYIEKYGDVIFRLIKSYLDEIVNLRDDFIFFFLSDESE